MIKNGPDEGNDEKLFDERLIKLLESNIYWKIAQLPYKILKHPEEEISEKEHSEKLSFYVYFWTFMALVLTLLMAYTLKLAGLLWAEVFNFCMIFFIPMGFLWLGIIFSCIELEERNHINNFDNSSIADLFSHWQTKLFSIRDPHMWILPIVLIVLGLISLSVSGLTITSRNLILSQLKSYKFFLLEEVIILFLSGHAVYGVIVNLIFQFKLAHHLPRKLKFMETGNKTVYYLSNYSYIQSLLLFGGYALFFLGVKTAKFSHKVIFNTYLAVLSVLPLLSLVWGIIQIHTFQVKVKFSQLTIIERKILHLEHRRNQIQDLAKLIEIKRYVEKMPEWPVSLQSVITLSITSAAVIIQILYVLGDKLTAIHFP